MGIDLRARIDLRVRDMGSTQTEVLLCTCEKLCGWTEGTEVVVSHQGSWLKDTRESIGCYSVKTRNNVGYCLGFDSDMSVGAFCAVDDDPSIVSEGWDGDDSFVTDVKIGGGESERLVGPRMV